MNDSKRWRTLMKRLAYLRAEAAESVESFEETVKEIEKNIEEKQDLPSEEKSAKEEIPTISGTSMIRLFSGKSSNERSKEEEKKTVTTESESETEKKEDSDDLKSHYKKLWRVIAKLTHPDSVGDNEELVSLYKAAAAAYEKDKREELLDVASEINVHLENPHPGMLIDLNRRCLHYEGMIRKIRDSVAWQWKNAQEGAKKEIIDLIKNRRSEKKMTNS